MVLLQEKSDGVLRLTLNRPEQYNALSDELLGALQRAFDAAAEDPSVRAVVLGGAGRAFCAGHDLKEMRAHPDQAYQRGLFERCSRLMLAIPKLPVPVVARVHGIATAAGCQLVAACDLAVAADVAKFAVSGVNVGLFCSTPAVALARNVGRKQAMEMLVTGEFIDAESARARGLVNRVVPVEKLDDEVAKLTAAIVAKSPHAIRSGKRTFYEQLDLGVAAAYDVATETMACDMMSEDAQSGIDAFIAKKPSPAWKGK